MNLFSRDGRVDRVGKLCHTADAMKTDLSIPPTLASALTSFLDFLTARNMSDHTITAYETDLRQFLEYLAETDITIARADQISKRDITEYLSHLAHLGRSGVTRARKIAAIKELFRYLVQSDVLSHSPADAVVLPRRERKQQTFLRLDEYRKMLAVAGGNLRDFAILTVFLQTGIRVSELANLRLAHLDLQAKKLTVVQGKGKKDRVVELEKKGVQALQNYLRVRPRHVEDDHLFLSYQERGLSVRGVQDIVEKYARLSGIEKKFSAHSLRHTFGTYKADKVSPWLLKEWMGHSSIQSTQLYVHMSREKAQRAMEETSL